MPTARNRDNAQRDKVFALLVERGDACDARTVADELGIHVTTARFHLTNLVAEGKVTTTTLRTATAGRPRVGYRATAPARVDELLGHLLAQLGSTAAARERAGADAGRVWADTVPARPGARTLPDGDLPDPITVATDTLTGLGFQVSDMMSAFGVHELRICSCPLKGIAAHHPEVARGVARGVLEQSLAASSPALASQYAVDVLPDPHGECEITLRLSKLPAGATVTEAI
ncbi:transcriptional regulator [Gordonia sp. ABSL1-1]|uniref:transcriptional regulator n=1 Tax=Gordonia sp. ABSL1-1 TaxID=3053923 RepID=UPI0025727650|nr:transcriptional regulator [Gordonia sp. ABSL1-1]MDL9936936.1 transcriptional regulator [Gordonia sp. ABSL1-1]